MKIYTKKGDQGQTSIIGKSGLHKHDERIDAYGTVDELNTYLGLLRSFPIVKKTKYNDSIFRLQTIFNMIIFSLRVSNFCSLG